MRMHWAFVAGIGIRMCFLLPLTAACGSDSDGGNQGTGGKNSGGSSGNGGDAGPTGQGPTISGLSWVDNPRNPLSGYVELTTDRAASVSITATSANNSTDVSAMGPEQTQHSVRVLGLKANRTYTLEVTVTGSDGTTTVQTLDVTMPPLPDDFPPIKTTISDPSRMQPGWTLFPAFRWNPIPQRDWGYLIAVDASGDVVWYLRATQPQDLHLLTNGNIVYNAGEDAGVELDVMGTEITRWVGADMGIDSLHHDVLEMPGGTFLTLGTELRTISGYNGGVDTYDVVGDIIAEFDRSGAVIRKFSAFDFLDPYRVLDGFDWPFWVFTYPDAPNGTKDWTHGNSVVYDGRDDSIVVSFRHQDWIVKLDRMTGAVIWKFGLEGDFTMLDGGDFAYHQHAVEVEPNGNLLVYDNGNTRPSLGTDPPYTRAVEYQLDESAKTAKVVWEFRNDPSYFSAFVGDVDHEPNGNYLVTDGGILADPYGDVLDFSLERHSRIVEVTGGAAPEVLFEMTMKDEATTNPIGYTIFRAERIAPLR